MSFVRLLLCAAVSHAFEVPLHPCYVNRGQLASEELSLLQESPLRNYVNVGDTQMQYSGELYIGSPPQRFSLIFDTGSAWTWVNDVSCGSQCHSAHAFNSSQSSSYIGSTTPISTSFGSASGEGYLAWETVSLPSSGDRVISQPIVLLHTSDNFKGIDADGVLGLSFSKLSGGYHTFVESLKAQGLISTASFAIHLNDHRNRNLGRGIWPDSSISFGSYDLEKYAVSDFTYVRVMSGSWQVALTKVAIGEKEIAASQTALFDSGTSGMTAPQAQFDSLKEYICKLQVCHEAYTASIVFKASQAEVRELPDIEVFLDGHQFVLPPDAFAVYIKDGFWRVTISPHSDDCWVLGGAFLRQFYSFYNIEKSTIGLAVSINTVGPSKTKWLVIACAGLAVLITGAVVVIWRENKQGPRALMQPLLSQGCCGVSNSTEVCRVLDHC